MDNEKNILNNSCSVCKGLQEYKTDMIKEEKGERIVVTCTHGRYWFKDDKFYYWNQNKQDKDDR
jgi:hypothetical protein